MYSKIYTAVCEGICGRCIEIETDVSRGLPNFDLVGHPPVTVRESTRRIKAAIVNSGYEFPRQRITVNMLPADIRKCGSQFDLPIAVGILSAEHFIDRKGLEKTAFFGELSMNGRVHGGILPMLVEVRERGIKKAFISSESAEEAALVKGMDFVFIDTLKECVSVLNGEIPAKRTKKLKVFTGKDESDVDFSDVVGQDSVKRAIVISGRHGLLMVGSPGCGKSMLARRIGTVMPKMDEEEILETSMIYSAAGEKCGGMLAGERPFRCPHYTIGRGGLIGGGLYPVPGEITLAHNGVLFMDEICEFSPDLIDKLRTPLEDKKIVHVRGGRSYSFPCDFLPVFAANPCKCGYYGDDRKPCICTPAERERYMKRLSGAILDRIDLHIFMERVEYEGLEAGKGGLSSSEMKEQVDGAIAFARRRSEGKPDEVKANGELSDQEVRMMCVPDKGAKKFLKDAYRRLDMTPRAYMKTLKVARTIADLDESPVIRTEHIAEAVGYRMTMRDM